MMTMHENFPRWKAQLSTQAIAQSLRKQTALFPHWQLRKQAVALPKLILAGNTTVCWLSPWVIEQFIYIMSLGPTSFLSICSRPGIDWVSERTREPRFGEIAGSLALGINRKLKLQRNLNQGSVPEPEPDTAWRYSKAYFENSFDTMFGVISRPEFEARLRYHLERNGRPDDDPAWYALRNTVYAFGCRVELSKASCATTLVEVEERAWQFFQKALSVHTELLYLPTGLMAVQALTAMSYFAEGIGSPSLEYMLCSCAMRLAQSKGLHRGAARDWNVPEPEQQHHRNRIFWAIYLLEKHISYRSGRSSVIDDEDITCQLPTTTPPTCTDDLGCFKYMVKHAQISSRITKRLATGSVFRQTPTQILEAVHELDLELQEWRDSLPSYFHPDKPISHDELPRSVHPYHALYLRYAYFGSVMAIHSIFTLPWNNSLFDESLPALQEQISLSSYIVVNAARSIILTIPCAQIDASTPTWLVLYFPLLSIINLFIYILKYPSLPTTQSDIALIEVAAGHFSRLEYASGDLARPFVREITRLARAVATAAEGKELPPTMSGREADESIQNTRIDPWCKDTPVSLQPPNNLLRDSNPPHLAISSERQTLALNAAQVGSADMANSYSDDWITTLLPPPASDLPALPHLNSDNTGSIFDFV
ncbi:hypothetical protein ASPBRDRAFT_321459 [Aspergillus brasiliensis CBS 101740]|uniref:Xylanolytic transcriptional activator regulatory domain-containing protein n=1 Tax=Aspergillus brasiliensis (strain CBS 101740 / IMI 381727 / IBT 21946) TaxID=767769 RepID=A0A1L9U979_ASPBC|nr:hypothetical protein ASPBRDRAFT_321459 [Aspergillus brasiliensis CBS 101740]